MDFCERFLMFVAAFLLVSAQAATAGQQVSAEPPVSAPAETPKKEKKICRVDDADSGSHMIHRVCLTAQEWQQRGQGAMAGSHSGISGKATDY
jgi:predicted secreted protein